MTGTALMQCLIVFYAIIAIAFAWEGAWWKVLYWCAAAVLTLSVLNMK